jgi:hypothetical protein
MSDDRADRIKAARLAQSRAAMELWNTRLDLLRRTGDSAGLLGHIASPVELAGDNCTCNNACNVGCGGIMAATSLPSTVAGQ